MRRPFGDPENSPGDGPRAFNKFPRWLMHWRHVNKLKLNEWRLIAFFSHKRGWLDSVSPWLTVTELAERFETTRDRISQALRSLEASGVIVTQRKGKKFRSQIVFQEPDRQEQAAKDSRNIKLPVRCPLDVEGRSSSKDRHQNGAVIATKTVFKLPSKRCDSYPSDWDIPGDAESLKNYEPGADMDIAQRGSL